MPRYSKSVLLIDDSPDDLLLFSHELRKLGLEIIATHSPEKAMSAIVSGTIGCFITDQSMPVSGQELVRLAHGVRADIAVIFLSGSPAKEGIPAGATFVDKGDIDTLRNAVLERMARWKVK